MTNEPSKPSYPLNDVKKLIKNGKINFNWETIHAFEDFGWKSEEIKKCILNLQKTIFINLNNTELRVLKLMFIKLLI